MQNKLKKQQKGFTLLELLIVMVILAILSGLGLMAFGTIQQKSRDSKRKQDLISISKSLETYYNDFGEYPNSDAVGNIVACGDGGVSCPWGDPWQLYNGTLYTSQLPQDPVKSNSYFYLSVPADNGYYLFAFLENEEDPGVVMNGSIPTFYSGPNCQNTDDTCNYVIQSSNLVKQPATIPIIIESNGV